MSNVVPFRRPVRPWQCPHCQTWMLHGSVTERMHGATAARCKHKPRCGEGRIGRLRMALCCPQTRAAIMRTTHLPEAALDRVALGRSTLARTQWRRVLEALGSGARS